jgi:signal transduction histidine kinase
VSHREALASRLSHELRTPIAVVRSSLDNLQGDVVSTEARVYVERAQGGLDRLAQILTRMSEATRLEQSIDRAEFERLDLAELVRGCVEGYRSAYAPREFVVDAPVEAIAMRGAPDLLAQMLDKLVANAVEFGVPARPIEVRVEREGGVARLAVANEGPLLPEALADRLFESMTSARDEAHRGGAAPHLGLGLYIVRLVAEAHGGSAQAENRPGASGVIVTVTLPIA